MSLLVALFSNLPTILYRPQYHADFPDPGLKPGSNPSNLNTVVNQER